jgi:hypothetical protein
MNKEPQELRILQMTFAAVTDLAVAVQRGNHNEVRELVEKHTIYRDSGRAIENFGAYVYGLLEAGVSLPEDHLRYVPMYYPDLQELGIHLLISISSESAQSIRHFLHREKDIGSRVRAAWKRYYNDEEIKSIKGMAFLWERVLSLAAEQGDGVVIVMYTSLASRGVEKRSNDGKRGGRRRSKRV